MYQFYFKINKINEKVNTSFIFVSPVTLKSYFDVALNKRNGGQGSLFCVWLLSCNDAMSLAVRKRLLRLTAIERPSNYNFNIYLNSW